jgi:hypothetical protein
VADRRKRFEGDPRRRGRPKERPRSRRERVRFWLGWWVFSLGLWMLLVFKTEPAEIVLGAVAAGFSATAAELVRSRGGVSFSPRARWVLALWRLPWEVLLDCALLTRALWRRVAHGEPIEGSFRVVHFEGCAGDDPRTQARRATAKWLGGVGPNNYVVGFEEGHDAVLLRQLVKTDRVPDVDPESRR